MQKNNDRNTAAEAPGRSAPFSIQQRSQPVNDESTEPGHISLECAADDVSAKTTEAARFPDGAGGICPGCGRAPACAPRAQAAGPERPGKRGSAQRPEQGGASIGPGALRLLAPKLESKRDREQLKRLLRRFGKNAAAGEEGAACLAGFVQAHWEELHRLLRDGRRATDNATKSKPQHGAQAQEDQEETATCPSCGVPLNPLSADPLGVEFIQDVLLADGFAGIEDAPTPGQLWAATNSPAPEHQPDTQKREYGALKEAAQQTTALREKAAHMLASAAAFGEVATRLAPCGLIPGAEEILGSAERAVSLTYAVERAMAAAASAVNSGWLGEATKAARDASTTVDEARDAILAAAAKLAKGIASFATLAAGARTVMVGTMQQHLKQIRPFADDSKFQALEAEGRRAEKARVSGEKAQKSVRETASLVGELGACDRVAEHVWRLLADFEQIMEANKVIQGHQWHVADACTGIWQAQNEQRQQMCAEIVPPAKVGTPYQKCFWPRKMGFEPGSWGAKAPNARLTLASTPPTTQLQDADQQQTGEPAANASTKKRRTAKQRLAAVEGDVAGLKGDVAGLKGDVAELKDRLTKVEGAVTDLGKAMNKANVQREKTNAMVSEQLDTMGAQAKEIFEILLARKARAEQEKE